MKIELKSQTRGGQKLILVSRDTVTFKLNESIHKRHIDKSQWNELLAKLKDMNVEHIEDYQSSSSDRSRDAAWHTRLSITNSEGTFISSYFDDTNAPKELLPIVQYLLDLDKKYNSKDKRIY
jgi:hypothetical protein